MSVRKQRKSAQKTLQCTIWRASPHAHTPTWDVPGAQNRDAKQSLNPERAPFHPPPTYPRNPPRYRSTSDPLCLFGLAPRRRPGCRRPFSKQSSRRLVVGRRQRGRYNVQQLREARLENLQRAGLPHRRRQAGRHACCRGSGCCAPRGCRRRAQDGACVILYEKRCSCVCRSMWPLSCTSPKPETAAVAPLAILPSRGAGRRSGFSSPTTPKRGHGRCHQDGYLLYDGRS